jgi:23S rRNA pseudouridine1911/1915/1917 synthase
MVVHPSKGHHSGTLVHGLLHALGTLPVLSGEERPGIVHRLDKGTSGLIVVAC